MGGLALVVFGVNLGAERHFVDESAYISQAFYADLLIKGDRDNPLWLDYPGYDLPPLPKYTIGAALWAAGFDRPGPAAARAWYADTSRQFVSPAGLVAARVPSVLFGAVGCVAIFAIGAMAGGTRVGWLAALGLMANPLYRMHARRAMSDVPSEAMILVAAAVGLWAWDRLLRRGAIVGPTVAVVFGSGLATGLAVLAKLNGALGGFMLGAWAALGLVVGPIRRGAIFAAGCAGAAAVAVGLFIALNPFVTARPTGSLSSERQQAAQLDWKGRLRVVKDHRVGVSDNARNIFPHDALRTPLDKLKAVTIQGFGRFGPFGPRGWTDSTRRYDWQQDFGAVVWLPCVLAGGAVALVRGRRQVRDGQPPVLWAVVLQAVVTLVTVTAFIPLAWDRYFLSIQPGMVLLAAIGLGAAWEFARHRTTGVGGE